jgi:hypothetical protein
MNVKSILKSKTIWFNIAAAILVLVEKKSGMSLVSPEIQVMGMAAINLGLRYITNSAISFTAPKA